MNYLVKKINIFLSLLIIKDQVLQTNRDHVNQIYEQDNVFFVNLSSNTDATTRKIQVIKQSITNNDKRHHFISVAHKDTEKTFNMRD